MCLIRDEELFNKLKDVSQLKAFKVLLVRKDHDYAMTPYILEIWNKEMIACTSQGIHVLLTQEDANLEIEAWDEVKRRENTKDIEFFSVPVTCYDIFDAGTFIYDKRYQQVGDTIIETKLTLPSASFNKVITNENVYKEILAGVQKKLCAS